MRASTEKSKIIKCPHLARWAASKCTAAGDHYLPSAFQLGEYCKSPGHRKCPFYLGMLEYKEAALAPCA